MIGNYLEDIRAEIESGLALSDNELVIGNISFLDSNTTNSLAEKVVMSLVKIEEERAFRYQELQTVVNNNLITHNPTVFLNLHILFSVCKNKDKTIVKEGLNTLTEIIEFFQEKNVFEPTEERPQKLTFELCTLTFEQMNHLWGILGGKYIPSVLYKVRIISVKALPADNTERIINLNVNETVL